MDWKNGPGERSRRIYEWWRVVMNGHNTKLKYFALTMCLISTVQKSSAASEILSSQLNFIRRVVGGNTLQDSLGIRCLLRCNNGLDNNYFFNAN